MPIRVGEPLSLEDVVEVASGAEVALGSGALGRIGAARDVVERAVARARSEQIPSLIEARTYRFRGHSMRDPAGAVYRTKEEVEREKLRDPIVLFRQQVLDAGLLTEADIKTLEKDVNDRVDDAVTFADASPEPPEEWLMADVYKEGE